MADHRTVRTGTDHPAGGTAAKRLAARVWASGLVLVLALAGLAVACQPDPVTCRGLPATIVGSTGHDTLNGTAGGDVIAGLAGNDVINGLGGDDVICADAEVAGNDDVDGGTGVDWIAFDESRTGGELDLSQGTARIQGVDVVDNVENVDTGPAADIVRGDGAANRFVLDRSDVVEGRGGDDVMEHDASCVDDCSIGLSYESAGAAVTVDVDARTATGGAGTDSFDFVPFGIVGSGSGDRIICQRTATPAECIVDGRGGADVITGSPAGDDLTGGLGNDRLDGAGGDDRAMFQRPEPVTVNLATGTATGQGTDTLLRIRQVVGSFGSDTLIGGPVGGCVLHGAFGDDRLTSGSAGCILQGAAGNDILTGSDGQDRIEPDGYGTTGHDTVHAGGSEDFVEADGGDDQLDGGPGNDVVDYGSSPAINANLTTGVVTGWGTDTVLAFESLIGSQGADTIRGSEVGDLIDARGGIDTVFGAGGDDSLLAGAGADWMHGGDGRDVVDGGPGNDTAYGGPGVDTVAFRYDPGGVTADLTASTSWSPTGSDRFGEVENLFGSEGDDVLRGDAGPNQINGAGGTDTCSGGGGTDVVIACP